MQFEQADIFTFQIIYGRLSVEKFVPRGDVGMKIQSETSIPAAFSVDKIIDVYYIVLTPYKMEHNNPVVCFNYWQLLYLDQGQYTCSIDGELITFKAGQVLLCAPGGKRYVVAQEDARVAYISFRCTSNKMSELKDKIIPLNAEQRHLVSRIFSIGIKRFVDIPDHDQFYGQQIMKGTTDAELQTMKNSLELLLIELADSLQDKHSAPIADNLANYYSKQFTKIELYMQQHITATLTIQRLSEDTGFSPSTIKRVFHYCVGMGAIHYFNHLKIKEAQRLICQTDSSMTQISDTLGFSSIHYFSRIFKSMTGMTPSQYGRTIMKQE